MIGLVRAVTLCATLALGLSVSAGRRQSLQARRPRRFRDQAGSPDQERSRTGRQDRRDAAHRRRRRLPAQRFPHRPVGARPDRGDRARRQRQLAAAGARHLPDHRRQSSSEQTFLLERASTAAYIAYQRAGNAGEEADALAVLGKSLPNASCGGRRSMRCGCRSICARSPTSAANTRRCATSTASGCSTTPSIRTPPRRAPASSSPRSWPSAPISRRSSRSPASDKPALSAEDKQLCVEGLKHGERYNITLRAGLPSTVKETLPKSAEFNVYVRDRKPFVRFTGKAYVLPRTGQRGIPVVSVNTPAVNVKVFRIGDRNLINTVVGSDFQKTLSSYELSRSRRRARRQGLERRARDRDRRSTRTSPPHSRSTRRSATSSPASM